MSAARITSARSAGPPSACATRSASSTTRTDSYPHSAAGCAASAPSRRPTRARTRRAAAPRGGRGATASTGAGELRRRPPAAGPPARRSRSAGGPEAARARGRRAARRCSDRGRARGPQRPAPARPARRGTSSAPSGSSRRSCVATGAMPAARASTTTSARQLARVHPGSDHQRGPLHAERLHALQQQARLRHVVGHQPQERAPPGRVVALRTGRRARRRFGEAGQPVRRRHLQHAGVVGHRARTRPTRRGSARPDRRSCAGRARPGRRSRSPAPGPSCPSPGFDEDSGTSRAGSGRPVAPASASACRCPAATAFAVAADGPSPGRLEYRFRTSPRIGALGGRRRRRPGSRRAPRRRARRARRAGRGRRHAPDSDDAAPPHRAAALSSCAVRIGVLTGGGDCPGLNAVIRAIVRKGIDGHGHAIVGFRDGWRGPLENAYEELTIESTRGILPRGGHDPALVAHQPVQARRRARPDRREHAHAQPSRA